MTRKLFVGFFFLLFSLSAADAQNCSSYPNILTNGTNADANQVMANFNAILNCVNTLALAPRTMPQGRLTLQSGTPVMTSTNSAKTVVYYTPYMGNLVPLYDGTTMVATTFTEVSQSTADSSKSPTAVVANSNYDIFCWADSGTNRCTRGPAWSSATARGTGAGTTELERISGVWLNKNAITNGPAANRGTYVGTIRSNSSSQVDWTFGATGTAASLQVWNAYNRVAVTTTVSDSSSSWTYLATTPRQANGSSINQINFVSGLAEDGIYGAYQVTTNTGTATGAWYEIGVGLDSTTIRTRSASAQSPAAAQMQSSPTAAGAFAPQLGAHFFAAIEMGNGSTPTTFLGQTYQALTGQFRM